MGIVLRALAMAVLFAAQCPGSALAADAYPARAVRIVVGYSPGTTSDVFARIIAQKLAERWGRASSSRTATGRPARSAPKRSRSPSLMDIR